MIIIVKLSPKYSKPPNKLKLAIILRVSISGTAAETETGAQGKFGFPGTQKMQQSAFFETIKDKNVNTNSIKTLIGANSTFEDSSKVEFASMRSTNHTSGITTKKNNIVLQNFHSESDLICFHLFKMPKHL